ncbi:MAG: hypothetical protein DHS20C13_00810 [Thermodesulfobacteriota bacterium]|nr:MAG: hypothetical protein DHS20C13_00810 [Thermodesulfobacteriota bacterium]
MNFLIILATGFIATGFMCLLLEFITKSKLANADMVRAIGSLYTGSYENALIPGLVIQFLSGMFFAFAYFMVMNFFFTPTLLSGILGGLIIGLFHGIVVGFALVITVAEHHPIAKFRKAGLTVASSHIAGHVIFGLTVGVIYAISKIQVIHSSFAYTF